MNPEDVDTSRTESEQKTEESSESSPTLPEWKKIQEKAEEQKSLGPGIFPLTEEEAANFPPNTFRIRESIGIPISEGILEPNANGHDRNDVTVIEQGWSLNGHYYGEGAVGAIANHCQEKVVGYFNHGMTNGRDPRDWAITIENGRLENNQVRAKIHIFDEPDGDYLRERLAYARKERADHLFGLSIDAYAQVSEGEAEGHEGIIVENVVKLNSVDIVMVPAAKGRFNVCESHAQEKPRMDVKTCREEHPDTARIIAEEAISEVTESFAKEKAELEARLEEASKAVASLTEDVAKAQVKIDEYEQAALQAQFVSEVDGLIESLPEEKRSEKFRGILVALGPEKKDVIQEMIDERKESQVAPVITGEGRGVVEAVDNSEPEEKSELPSDEDRLALLLGG